jgi:hypothetical protein
VRHASGQAGPVITSTSNRFRPSPTNARGASAAIAWAVKERGRHRLARILTNLPTIAVRLDDRPSSAAVSANLTGARTETTTMLGRLSAAMSCLSLLLVTAAPLHALAQDGRPVPPLPIGPRQATASDHARDLSEMADREANISARCQSSGAALGSPAYKKCRASLEDRMFELTTPAARRY